MGNIYIGENSLIKDTGNTKYLMITESSYNSLAKVWVSENVDANKTFEIELSSSDSKISFSQSRFTCKYIPNISGCFEIIDFGETYSDGSGKITIYYNGDPLADIYSNTIFITFTAPFTGLVRTGSDSYSAYFVQKGKQYTIPCYYTFGHNNKISISSGKYEANLQGILYGGNPLIID